METHSDFQIVFVHIPHTAGRAAKRYLWTHYPRRHLAIHTPEDISGLPPTSNTLNRYFVLRHPLQRIIAEYIHYSATLLDPTGGRIGYLSLDGIRKHTPAFNPASLIDYVQLPLTNDLCCKLLLLRTDWSSPVTETEYQQLLQLIDAGKIKYDNYVVPMQYTQLASLLAIDTESFSKSINDLSGASYNPNPLTNAKKLVMLQVPGIMELVTSRNAYDYRLYAYCSAKSV